MQNTEWQVVLFKNITCQSLSTYWVDYTAYVKVLF